MENATVISKRSWAVLYIFATLVIMLVVACGGTEESKPITVSPGAQAGELSAVEPCTYVTGEVEYVAECNTLAVPENRSDPDSRLIALPVMRILTTGSNPEEPVFWLNGGPGQSNMRFFHPDDLDTLLENHDFVMVGYRGVDGQILLDCPEISEALRDPPGNLLGDAALESYGAAADRCAQRLQSEGVDLAGYTMTETIDDMEAARKALGFDQINLLSTSYGTRLAMIYEWMYPEKLFRAIMLAVNTPGHFVWDAKVIDAQIQDYAHLCVQDAECSARTANLAETMLQVSRNMPDRWLFLPIDKDTVDLFTLVMLFESIQPPGDPIGVYGPAAADIWLSAAEGDASGMALVSMMRNMFLPNYFTWGHLLAIGGGTGEYADPTRDYLADFKAPGTILGSPLSLLILGMGTKWPTSTIPEEYLQLQPSDVETLLVAGSIDFMTPPQGADELLPYLSNGQRVLLQEFGHGNTFWNSQPEARLHLLNTFFDSGEVDSSLYGYQPLEFDTGLGWPGLAKLLLGIVLVLLILLASIVWFIIRLVQRRKARLAKGDDHE